MQETLESAQISSSITKQNLSSYMYVIKSVPNSVQECNFLVEIYVQDI